MRSQADVTHPLNYVLRLPISLSADGAQPRDRVGLAEQGQPDVSRAGINSLSAFTSSAKSAAGTPAQPSQFDEYLGRRLLEQVLFRAVG